MHWLSYSNSDQSLLRAADLESTWDALVVPGTLAAFYFNGTGGFVLARGRPYVIDPRTPLLQEVTVARPEPRKSHLALAEIHDPSVPPFWPEREIPLTHWEDGHWPDVVRRVLDFQDGYSSTATAKIDKYAELLREATGRSLAIELQSPHRLVPPYWAVTGPGDPWWALSAAAIEIALDEHDPASVMPILATTNETPIARFAELIAELPAACEQVFCWRGAWDEARATDEDVNGWAATIEASQQHGVRVTNLYGGYLSVLLLGLGLDGLNHGIGYSEQRDARRLSETGAPPTRYYMPALRSFVPRASAQPIIDSLPAEWACQCRVCESVRQYGVPVVDALSNEDLKRHFLICRSQEINRVTADLEAELDRLDEVVAWLQTRDFIGAIPSGIAARLDVWATSIRRLT